MRFDASQALGWAETFAFPRRAGTEGERRAAEIVAEELARVGLRIERVAVQGARLPAWAEAWLGWVGVAGWATALALATRLGASWPSRLVLAFVGVLWLFLNAVEGFRRVVAWPRRLAATNVVAWRDDAPEAPVRVVFQTPIDTFDPGRAIVPPWLDTPVLGLLLAMLILLELFSSAGSTGRPAWPVPMLLGLLWLATGGRAWRLIRRGGSEPDVRDNRTGLAVLLEQARSWPRATHARIETRFVATGGQTLDRAGLRALFRAIEDEWPAKPTLVVEWLAPGIGPGLALLERGTGRLAETAADDLWMPYRVIHRAGALRDHCPPGRRGPSFVAIVGAAIDRAPTDRPIEPDALARAAQLATEVALRWAKENRPPGAATSGR
jgi:hypothetical protein